MIALPNISRAARVASPSFCLPTSSFFTSSFSSSTTSTSSLLTSRQYLIADRPVSQLGKNRSLTTVIRSCSSSTLVKPIMAKNLKIAIIGQSVFATEVYNLVRKNGHTVVGVFTIPDKNGREDPLATKATADGVPVFKFKSWRLKGVARPAVLAEYQSVGADLNVMPYCSQFIPMEVVNHPSLKSICYHPSLLPRHRGASAITWTLIEGDTKGGFSIFYPDDGLDTGDLLLTRECNVSV